MIPNTSLFCVSVCNSVNCAVNLALRSKCPAGKMRENETFLSMYFNKALKDKEWMI